MYTSIPLKQTLAEQQTHFSGTITKNRVGLPDVIRAPFNLEDDGTIQFRADRLMVIAWRAKAKKTPVIMLSSSCSAGLRDVQNRKCVTVNKQVAVDEYNHFMNGVDRNDKHCIYYSFVGKTLKWWRKLFFYFLKCATINSYILHKEIAAKPLTALEFHRSVIEAVVLEHMPNNMRTSVGHLRLGPTPTRLNRRLHLLD